MSGGHFEYKQHQIREIKDSIQHLIEDNADLEEPYPEDIIEEFKNAVKCLKLAYTYSQRIDWLVSGDDGNESFREKLKEELLKENL